MLVRYCVFAVFLMKLGCLGARWQVLEDFKLTISKYSRTGDDLIKVIEDFVAKKKSESLEFLYNIDNMPYLERSELRPYCTQVYQRLEGLLYSFKTDMAKLETPLVSVQLEIKEKLSGILSTIDIYQKLADNKLQNCKEVHYICEDHIVHWLKERVDRLHCRMSATCPQHVNRTRYRRSVSDCEEFRCNNGDCIAFDSVCDNSTDCKDNSDETANCTKFCFDGFHCKDLRCIEKKQICDGTPDCGDGSDEKDCKPKEVPLSPATCNLETGKFLCNNKHCVPLAEVCDGKDHCGDGSDEGGKCEETTLTGCTANGGVDVRTPEGPRCVGVCPDGMVDGGGVCRAGPQRNLANLEGIFEQIPYLMERYIGAVWALKRRLINNIEKTFVSCRDIRTELISLKRLV